MIVLDTNIVSEAMKPAADPAVRAWLNEQVVEMLYLTSSPWRSCCSGLPRCRQAGAGTP